MTENRRLLAYKDLDTHYATPATGGVGSAGWFRQANNNFSLLYNSTQIRGAHELSGVVEFAPTWAGVTTVEATSIGGYIRVGQIVYLWARADITEVGTEGAGVSGLPVTPSGSILSMCAGHGYVNDGGTTYLPFTALISGDGLLFYYAAAATDGRVIHGDPLGVTGTGVIAVYASYRCDPPPDGYLADQNYVFNVQEAV